MSGVLAVSVTFALGAVIVGLVACFVRVIIGPSLADRVLALDLLTIAGAGFMAITGIAYDDVFYLDIALILIATGFVSTVVFAQFITRGDAPLESPSSERDV